MLLRLKLHKTNKLYKTNTSIKVYFYKKKSAYPFGTRTLALKKFYLSKKILSE